MNKYFTMLVVFAAGSVVGFLVTEKYIKKTYDDLLSVELEDVRKRSRANVSDWIDTHNTLEGVVVEKKPVEVKNPRFEKPDINTLIEKYKDTNTEKVESEYPIEPYQITQEEYDNFPNHEKVELSYYVLDDTLCDANEDIIPGVIETIGDHLDVILESEEPVYIRNENYGADYEIVRIDQSFRFAVLGDES